MEAIAMMKRSTIVPALALLCLTVCGTARAQSPVVGLLYQVPVGYAGYAAGSVISYGGYPYVTQGDGTMVLGSSPTYSYQPTAYHAQPVTYSWYPYQTGWGLWGWRGYSHCHYRRYHWCF
jgi:hypothetical protein